MREAFPFPSEILACLKTALEEDIGTGDVTSNSIVPGAATISGEIVAKQSGIVAGLDIAEQVFLLLDERMSLVRKIYEGSRVAERTVLATVNGSARALLTGERTAL